MRDRERLKVWLQSQDWDQWRRTEHGGAHWEGGEWWMQERSGEAWRSFGRRVFLGVLLLVALGVIVFGGITILLFQAVGRWLLVSPLVVLLIGALVARSGLRTWRPVRRLIAAAGRLADGDYSVRVDPVGSASIRPVAASFNDMAARLEHADEQRRRLLADLGHELRTPLTVIRGEVEAIRDGVHAPDAENLQILIDEVAVMERLLEDLRTLSLAEAGSLELHPEPTDVADLVRDVAESHGRTTTGVDVKLDVPEDLEVVVDPVRIREVVTNLVVNAIRAMPGGGTLSATVEGGADHVRLSIGDTGVGIGADDIDAVFDRFTKGSSSAGSGLGLTISRDLVEAHGGTIELTSTPGVGTTATVRLPRTRVTGAP